MKFIVVTVCLFLAVIATPNNVNAPEPKYKKILKATYEIPEIEYSIQGLASAAAILRQPKATQWQRELAASILDTCAYLIGKPLTLDSTLIIK